MKKQPLTCGKAYLVTACRACDTCDRRKAAVARRRAWRERVEHAAAQAHWADAMKG